MTRLWTELTSCYKRVTMIRPGVRPLFMRFKTPVAFFLHTLAARRTTKCYYFGRNWRLACVCRRKAAWRRTRHGCRHLLGARSLAWSGHAVTGRITTPWRANNAIGSRIASVPSPRPQQQQQHGSRLERMLSPVANDDRSTAELHIDNTSISVVSKHTAQYPWIIVSRDESHWTPLIWLNDSRNTSISDNYHHLFVVLDTL